MEPITRKEKFYAAAAGDAVALPEPVSREEKWLHRMATRFGDTPTGGDTLTWDGNTEGLLEVVGQEGCAFEGLKFYKVSDVVLTEEEIYGAKRIYEGGQIYIDHSDPDIVRDEITEMFECAGLGMLYGLALCAQTDNYTFQGTDGITITVPKKGIYFAANTTAFQLIGSTKFPGVKQIDQKYLPVEGVYLDLGEVTGAEEQSGAVPNASRELYKAISDALACGKPVRCVLTIDGWRTVFTDARYGMADGGLVPEVQLLAFNIATCKQHMVELVGECQEWIYVPDVTA